MRTLIFCALVCLFAWASPARADDSAAKFNQAVELYTANKWSEALPLFRQAHEATGSPNARIYVARCLQELGQLPEAYEQMKATVREATERAEQDDKYVPTRDSAAAELAILERKVGKLVVMLTDPPEGARVEINGRSIEMDQLGLPAAVAPGEVTVTASAPGKQALQRAIEVPAGQTRALTLRFADEAGPVEPPPDEGESSGGGVRIAGFVIGGVGLVGLGVFAITASMAKSEFDDLDAQCGGQTCPATEQGRVDDGRTLQTIANVSLVAGSALLVGGVAMIIFGGPSEVDSADSAGWLVAPAVGPTEAGLTVRGHF